MKRIYLTLLLCILLVLTLIYLYRWTKFTDALTIRIDHSQDNIQKNSFLFDYIIDSPPCSDDHRTVMIVTSYFGHVELRSAHRRAYSNDFLNKSGIKRVFLLASVRNPSRNTISQKSVENESARFEDIIQGGFEEAYRNLTYKHLMGLDWVSRKCPNAKLVLKMDDDMVYSIRNLLSFMKTNIHVVDESRFLLGYVMTGMKPIRNRANKWFVTYSEYPKTYYPPFLSGWMYFTTPATASKIVEISGSFPYFWIDDVFVTGILASKLNVKLQNLRNSSVFLEFYELVKCCMDDMVNKNINCEFVVGPNGGDDNMIVKFVEAVEHCEKTDCFDRPSNFSLKDTCIVSKSLMPLHGGNSSVNVIKL